MKLYNPFRDLSKFEWILWLISVCAIIGAFLMSGGKDGLTIIASLIGVTALIFIAKGYVIGQILIIVFALFYGIISFFFRYYGEMLTYLGMSAPMAFFSLISWIKHPYQGSREVEVHRLTKKQFTAMCVLTIVVTIIFYYLLEALGNANLLFSTISVTTSFIASYLTFFRSPYYAVGYAANDVILIVLWVLAAIKDISCLPMIICFVMFLVNDLYGFYSWRRMQKRQNGKEQA